VVSGLRAASLEVTITTAAGAVDAAVAQTRALFDRLRQGALSEADVARATALRDESELAASLDPRTRLVALWRGDAARPSERPSLDALRAFSAQTLHDDALVIVALRPRPARTP
jgi:hypothetical protein